jgi:hypothetical protein
MLKLVLNLFQDGKYKMGIIVFLISILSFSASAQNNQVNWSVFTNGFGLSNSGDFAATSSAGESFAGVSTNGNSKIVSGFLAYTSSIITGLTDELEIIPTVYNLSQNYPNPFNPSTIINYQIPVEGFITLKVYDILGNEVKTLVNEQKAIGSYNIHFDASDLASGMYIYQISVNNPVGSSGYTASKKLMLIK